MRDDWIDQARKQREIEANATRGPIRPRTDPRCFKREMLEEILDAMNYNEWARRKGEINWYKFKKMNNSLRFCVHLLEITCEDSFWWRLEVLHRPGTFFYGA